MADYTSATIIKARYPTALLSRLTDKTDGSVDDAKIEIVCLDADAIINTYITPVSPVPKIIEYIANVIVMYELCVRYGSDNPFKGAYERAMKMLEKMSADSIYAITLSASNELVAGIDWPMSDLDDDLDQRKDIEDA